MLTSPPPLERPPRPTRPLTRRRAWLLALMVLVILALRHDFWNWTSPQPLLGFLPVGLWWQAGVSILACVMMGLMVRWAWPQHLEEDAMEAQGKKR